MRYVNGPARPSIVGIQSSQDASRQCQIRLPRFPSAQWRLRVYNADNRYAWSARSSGIQSWEPERRVMLSLTLGE